MAGDADVVTGLERAFLADILEHPAADMPRLVYADWLDEAGRGDDAFAQRWMARTGLRPGYRTHTGETWRASSAVIPPRRKPQARYRWGWWPERGIETPLAPAHARLPRPVFLALAGPWAQTAHRYYPSEEAAVADLARALAELRRVLGLNG